MKKIRVKLCGDQHWPRYALFDEQDQSWWVGDGWTPDRQRAILFAHWNDLAQQYKKLEEDQLRGIPCRDFQCAVNVRVWSRSGYSLQALLEYLLAAIAVNLNVDEKGTGPVGSSVRVEIDWSTLQEKGAGTQP